MTDKELLELAAKAAGIDTYDMDFMEKGYLYGNHKVWAPLTNNGDALWLAVKLRLELHFMEGGGVDVVKFDEWGNEIALASETAIDEYAATRRAMVRAAAEIGKGMK